MHTMNNSSTSTASLVNNYHFRPNTVTLCTESENYPHTPKTSQQTNEQTSSISPKVGKNNTQAPQHFFDFITNRNKNRKKHTESLELESSVDEDCSCIKTSKLKRSCPEISPKNREELGKLRAKINYLEKKLESAEKEIDNLSIENSFKKKKTNHSL
ncbi:unnamed protein product [Parnassius apollo]|uniref:(apollo) hypothetical protein n=1 Tax=Parnassius apollo TaxID=110799 RepID=A0A8S3W1Y5_PARAO|nr:unnamed protein product [Parnassius apollo]